MRFFALLAVLMPTVAAGAAAAQAPAPVGLQRVATLESPLYVTHAGDGRLFIVERAGAIRIHTEGQGVLATPFLDLSSLVDTQRDGGLFTLAFHPDHALNGFFFVSYTEDGTGGFPLAVVIARYQVSATDPNLADASSARVLLRVDQPAADHNNGQIAFGPDGYLYVGFGDGGGQGGPGCRAQHGDVFYGKILRLDVDQNAGQAPYYGIPSGNPFAAAGDGFLDEIWGLGFRNPWRFSFDRQSGDLWVGDVGQNAREEVDRQPASSGGGENYGWKLMEGTLCFDPDPIDPDCPAATASCFDPAYTDPVYEYANLGFGSDACSITGGYVYRGDAIPELQGHYVFGDWCGGTVWSLDPESGERSELLDREPGLTSFGEDAAGELYVTLGDDVFRLVPAASLPALERPGLALLVLAALVAGGLAGARWR